MKLNNELTPSQEAYRRGSTSFHAKKALTGKAVLAYIRENPGSTKRQICDALKLTSDFGAFAMLQFHRLARCEHGKPQRWYATEP